MTVRNDAARAEAGSSGHAREAVQAEVVPAKSPRSKFGRASKERAGRSSKEKMGKEADIEVKVQAKEEKAPFGRLLGMQKESYLLLAEGYIASNKNDLAQELCRKCLTHNKSCLLYTSPSPRD